MTRHADVFSKFLVDKLPDKSRKPRRRNWRRTGRRASYIPKNRELDALLERFGRAILDGNFDDYIAADKEIHRYVYGLTGESASGATK